MIEFWNRVGLLSAVNPQVLAGLALAVVLAVAITALLWQRRIRRGRARGVTQVATVKRPASRVPESLSNAALVHGLSKTRRGFLSRLGPLLGLQHVDEAAQTELEAALLAADVGPRMTARLLADLQRKRDNADASLRRHLEQALLTILESPGRIAPVPSASPWVIMVVGVNGVGKTTSIAKLARRHASTGKHVLLIAADTFRAAAIEQLAVWAERAGAALIRGQHGGDPGAVVYDGMRAAIARKADVVIVDTAGRLHTKTNLLEELRKIRRIMRRELPGAPHETLLVLDAVTGQNGLAQARAFLESLEVDGVILTKLDGTAKGGIVVPIAGELGIPIRYVGVGEAIDDLRDFDPEAYVAALFEPEAAPPSP